MTTPSKTAILKLPQVIEATGLGRTSIYMKIKEGVFPPPITLSMRSVGWLENQVQEFIKQRVSLSNDKICHLASQHGLYIECYFSGEKQWQFIHNVGKKRKAVVLGQYPEMSLAEAKAKKAEYLRTNSANKVAA